MAYNDDAQIFERQIVIENTSQQVGVTSGSIVNKGTLSTLDTYITGHTIVNNVQITPNLSDIIFERQATLANNQASFTDIAEFFFDDSITTSFKTMINVTVSDTLAKHAVWEINGLYKPTGWVITSSFTGDLTGVQFSIDNQAGGIAQIQYKNANTAGTTVIRYRATTTAPPGTTPIGVSNGVITNTSGPFLANNLIYANTADTLASTDIIYNSNVFTIGGASRLLAEKGTDFVNFSNGGAITSMGDVSVAKRVIVGQKVGIATTAPGYTLDVGGDINFTGNFYKNNNIYSGSEIWETNGTGVFYTKGNIGFGTSNPSYQLDVSGDARITQGLRADTVLASTSISSGLLLATNVTASNIVATAFSSGSVAATGISTGTLQAPNGITVGNINFTGSLYKNGVAYVGSQWTTTSGNVSYTSGSVVASNVVGNVITVGTLLVDTITAGNLSLSGDLFVAGTVTSVNISTTNVVDINISTGTLTSQYVNATSLTAGNSTFNGDIIPSSTLTYDLGSANNRWRTLYLSGNTIDLGGTLISANTTGSISFGETVISTTTSGTVGSVFKNASVENAQITASSTGSAFVGELTTTNITTGTLRATGISILSNITSSNQTTGILIATTGLSTGTIYASGLSTLVNVTATNFSAGVFIASTGLTTGTISASGLSTLVNVTATNFSAGTLVASTGLTTGTLYASGLSTLVNVTATNTSAGNLYATTLLASTSVSSANIVATNLTAGSIKTSDIALNGNLVATGDITAFGNLSDRRLKTNIINIDSESALSTVRSLRPVTFDWRDDIFNESKRGTCDVGFIAQEVEEIVPQAVGDYQEMNSGNVYKNIKHERLLPYLVGAIQKLEYVIEQQQLKIDQLEQRFQ